jgi:hypothetical protein
MRPAPYDLSISAARASAPFASPLQRPMNPAHGRSGRRSPRSARRPRVAEPGLAAILAHQACASAGETCRAGEQPILLCSARGFRRLAAYGSITLRCWPTPPAWAAIVPTTC